MLNGFDSSFSSKVSNKQDLALNQDTSTDSTREQRHPLVSGRWKVCLVRDSLPSEDISRDDTERIQPLWIDRFLKDSKRFSNSINMRDLPKIELIFTRMVLIHHFLRKYLTSKIRIDYEQQD